MANFIQAKEKKKLRWPKVALSEEKYRWLGRGVLVLAPLLAFTLVEYLNYNDPWQDFTPMEIGLNLIWYYLLELIFYFGRGRRVSAAKWALGIAWGLGMTNHYLISFRGRTLFPGDFLTLGTAVNVAGNKLTDMSGAVVCSNLTTLDLSDNQLSTMSSSMVLMKKLKSLDVSNNKLSSIPGLPSSLTSLSLSGNRMTDLSFTEKLIALEYLDASDNLITSAAGLPVANLQTLYLENNQLKTLGDLVGAKNCTMDVSHNIIDTYSNTEQSYSETLRLSGCAVTAVPQNLSGWQYQNGAVYYFTNTTGTYVTGTTTISGVSYTFGSNGVLSGTEEKAPVKYEDPSPSDNEDDENIGADKPTGDPSSSTNGTWQQSGDNWYLVDENGNMLTGWQKYDTAWYYMAEDGTMQTGWLQDGNTYYYLYDWGGMATGWYQVGSNWFYSNGAGEMLANKWLEYKDEWYYLKSSGAMAKSWLELGGKWYYMSSDGVMQTGWQEIGGETYYMSTTTGYCATGWCKIDGKTYYFDPVSCKMARNTTINGYKVDENGVYIES